MLPFTPQGENWQKLAEPTFFRTVEINQRPAAIQRLLEKLLNLRTVSLVAFQLALFPFPPTPFQLCCILQTTAHNRGRSHSVEATGGVNGVGAFSNSDSQRIIIIWLDWWHPRRPHLQVCLYFAWSEFVRCEKLFSQGHPLKKEKKSEVVVAARSSE